MNQTNETPRITLGSKLQVFSWAKLGLFSVSSVVLSSSMLLAVFNAFPLALAGLFFGRTKGLLAALFSALLAVVVWWKIFPNPALIGAQGLGIVVGLGMQEIFLRKISPIKGLMSLGFSLLLLTGLSLVFLNWGTRGQLTVMIETQVKAYSDEILKNKQALISSGEEENRQALDLLERPDVLTEQIIQAAPTVIFSGVFLWPWVNLLVLLRLRKSYFFVPSYPYNDRDVINYHVPQWVLIPTMAAMALTFFGDMLITPDPAIPGGLLDASAWGKTALQMIGVFYFFQGMGIYLDFLDALHFKGPLRHLLVIATVISGPWVIALFGLFDLWVNFRRFFRLQTDSSHKKKGE